MSAGSASPSTGGPERLHPRIRLVWGAWALAIGLAVLAVGWLVGRYLADRLPVRLGLPVLVALAGLVAAVGLALAVLRYRAWRYALEADALALERGVLTRVETAVPYVRVQHIDTHRGPVERLAGLSSVVVYTAGTRGADVTVPGLAPERARRLRDRLRTLAVAAEPGDAV